MTVLLYTLGVLAFVVAIVASIALHELGHLATAKRFGCKVTQYFIGFGPTVWSRQIGETEYGLKAVPLGGFVKIVGMLPPGAEEVAEQVETDADGRQVVMVRKSNTGMFTQLIADARAAEWELVGPADTDRLFYKLSWWKKVVVMAAGPTVNLAIAFLVFAGLFATYGNAADPSISPVVSSVSPCVVPYAEDGRKCTAADPVTPAVNAGIEPGDRIVAFNGHRFSSWEGLQTLIRGNEDGRADITVIRDGATLTLHTNTLVTPRPTSMTDDTLVKVGFLGVSPTDLGPTTGGPGYTLVQMGDMTARTVEALGTLPVEVWKVGRAIVGLEERSPESPVSVVGGGRLAGETTSDARFPLVEKLVFLLVLTGGFNLFIGLFNFVPLPPLDGGQMAGAFFEQGRRVLARLRRRPDPGYFDVAKLLPLAYTVAAVFVVMGVVLIVGDIVAPVQLS